MTLCMAPARLSDGPGRPCTAHSRQCSGWRCLALAWVCARGVLAQGAHERLPGLGSEDQRFALAVGGVTHHHGAAGCDFYAVAAVAPL